MKNVIKINCKETYELGISYSEEAKKLEKAMLKASKIISEMNECWKGVDYTFFYNNCANYLNEVDKELKKIKFCASSMKETALSHGEVDLNFADQMKRRLDYER